MRVLCFSEKWESGGIESLLTSLYETMDLRDRDGAPLQVDIVACEYEPGIYDDRLAARGLSVRQLSGSTRDYRRNLAMFDELLRERRYDVAHLNLYEGLALLFARHARRAGVGRVIVHSHNAGLRPSSLRSLKMALHRASVRVLADDADLRYMFAKSVFSCITTLFTPSCTLSDEGRMIYVKEIRSNPRVQKRCRETSGGVPVNTLCRILRKGSPRQILNTFHAVALVGEQAPDLFMKIKHRK